MDPIDARNKFEAAMRRADLSMVDAETAYSPDAIERHIKMATTYMKIAREYRKAYLNE